MNAIRALMLVLALSVCVYAGDMPNGRPGNMPYGKAVVTDKSKTTITESITEIVWRFLPSVLSLI